MKGRYTQPLVLLFLACRLVAYGQGQPPKALQEGNLQQQFDLMVDQSSNYQQYEVVPRTLLQKFWTHVNDTLNSQRDMLRTNRQNIDAQHQQIEEYKARAAAQEETLAALQREKDSLSLLGIAMDKRVYHTLVWAIIAALVVGLLFLLGRFRYANAITRKTRKDNQELQEKVEQLRKRMLEKEQELRRQLQDEINKRQG